MFPVLFVLAACGALSGFHSLVSSSTSSKQVSNETDAVKVGYGAMVLESFVGVLAIIIAGIMFSDMNTAGTGALNNGVASTPFQIFAAGIARGMKAFGVDGTVATVFMTMNVSALALTSLDAVARIARTSFSGFFAKCSGHRGQVRRHEGPGQPLVCHSCDLVLAWPRTWRLPAIWPSSAPPTSLGGMTMITPFAVFCKCKETPCSPRPCFLLRTFTSLVQSIMGCVTALSAGTAASVFNSVLQLVFAILLVVLGLIVAVNYLRELFTRSSAPCPTRSPRSELGAKKNCGVEAPRPSSSRPGASRLIA